MEPNGVERKLTAILAAGNGFLIEQPLDVGRDALDDDRDAARVGVHAVGLVELRSRGDPVEEEGIEGNIVLGREARVDIVEGCTARFSAACTCRIWRCSAARY